MKIKLLLVSLFFSVIGWGQIISWDFASGNMPIINLPGGVTSLSYNTGGTNGTSGCTGNGFSTTNWNVNEYLQIVAPTTGFEITTLTFNVRSSGTGPLNFKVQYSTTGTGGVFTDLGTTFTSGNGVCVARSADFTSIDALDNNSNTVIRLVFTGGEADGTPTTGDAASAGTFRIDDLMLNGSTCHTATFDSSTKSSYTEDIVNVNGKEWVLGECFIGSDPGNDYFIGTKSARLRANANSLIELNNSLTTGLSTVNFSYRAYQNSTGYDAITAIFSVDYSKDNGNSWTEIGTITPSSTVQTFSATVNQSGNVKFRIKYKSGTTNDNHRVNIDSIELCPYSNIQEIEVFGNSTSILDGATSTKLSNETDFGDTYFVGDASIIKTYTVTNYGTGTLNLTGLTISGSSDFVISALSSSSLSAGASATFTVTFSSSTAGLKSSEISIANNDSDENPFTFTVSCFSNNYIKCALQAMSTVAFQDFEGAGSLSYVSTGGSSAVAGGQNYGDNRITMTNMFIGSASYQVTGASSNVLEFNNVDSSNYENLQFSFRIGAYATTTSQGMETSDKVLVSVSEDGGATWKEQLILRGNNNSISDIATSSGSSITVIYDNTSIAGKAYGMNDNSTNTYSNLFTISDLPAVAQLKVKFSFLFSSTGGTNEIWSIDEVKVQGQLPQSTTWYGTTWSAGIPTTSTKAIFEEDYNTSIENVQACECEIKSTSNVVVSLNGYLEVQSDIINSGTLTIEDGGSLVQVDDYAENTGSINMMRTAFVDAYDYVYWSSPVAGFNSINISPTTTNRITKWIPTLSSTVNNHGTWVSGSEVMETGRGYIERGLNASPIGTPIDFTATFTGIPNNGIYNKSISRGSYNGDPYDTNLSLTQATRDDDNWNLVGNPYPSSISLYQFLDTNTNIDGYIYVWAHGITPKTSNPDPFYNNFAYNYDANDYIKINKTGTTAGSVDDYFIGAGQGFFVLMPHSTTSTNENIIFNNAMRKKDYRNDMFYRTSNNNSNEQGRVWLDIVSSNSSSRTLVGYVEGATNEKDRLFDAKMDLQLTLSLFSIIGDEGQTIQGRALPFDQKDVVPLGFRTPAVGRYNIAIGEVDGFFNLNSQSIFIEDKYIGVTHNLSEAPYSFDASEGLTIDRFILRFANDRLSNAEFDNSTNGLKVFEIDNNLNIVSESLTINEYEIYNILGQKLVQRKNVFENRVKENSLLKTNQTLIVKVTFENGQVISKKVIF